MKKALIVLDMQEDYVGEKRNQDMYSYDDTKALIKVINAKIDLYDPENVIYYKTVKKNNFINRMIVRYALEGTEGCELVKGMKVVSDNIFEKQQSNAFVKTGLYDFLKENGFGEIEIVGIDGGDSVPMTAQCGVESGFLVEIYKKGVGTIFKKRADMLEAASATTGVKYI